MKKAAHRSVVIAIKDAHATVALWQWLALIVLILAVLAIELLDLPALLFGAEHRPFEISRACVYCAAILIGGIVLVGHTYLQQQQVIRGLVSICSYCKKIRVDHAVWQQIEEYVGERGDVMFTHGICPDCYKTVMASMDADDKKGACSTPVGDLRTPPPPPFQAPGTPS